MSRLIASSCISRWSCGSSTLSMSRSWSWRRASGGRLSRRPCMAAMPDCICSISSSRFCGGLLPKRLPYFSMKPSKSGSPPAIFSESILLRSCIISFMRAMSSGLMLAICCWRSLKKPSIMVCFSIAISSWYLAAASGSMNSYSCRPLTLPPASSGKFSSCCFFFSTTFFSISARRWLSSSVVSSWDPAASGTASSNARSGLSPSPS